MRTILVHVNGIRASRLRLRVGVDLSGAETADIVRAGSCLSTGTSKPELLVFLRLRLVQQLLIPLQALRRRAADNRGYCPPLGGHELGEVEQLLVLRLRLGE